MATYRLSAQVVKRSAGRSVTAAAAYRAGVELVDERLGQTWDYRAKGGVLHSEILAPEDAPEWMRDRSQLWNAVERVEKRRDAQLAREIQLSLPHELSHAQRVELVREFVADEFVSGGMIADFAVHAPDRGGDERNHHAHVLLTMRNLTGEGFGNKNRDWNDTEQLEAWREDWAQAVNQALEKNGHEARVDHRSYEDRGIDREPEPKQGPVATEMERDGKPSHAGDDRRAVQSRNAERETLEQEAQAIERESEALRKRPAADGGGSAVGSDIADAKARYETAYREHFKPDDPYASLAKVAFIEHGLFRAEQQALDQQLAEATDPEQRRRLALRKEIEGCDYMVLTSERIAQQNAEIGMPNVAADTERQREKARFYQEQGQRLREERELTAEQRLERLQAQMAESRRGADPDSNRDPDRSFDLER